ncbi:hypothetical protein E4H12_01965 [Candidatus Thorarchaeota archaeon]|nr:MAG: hypothetical protein E4H12_01965 [Candidatus Thorarchaeota archaeon]
MPKYPNINVKLVGTDGNAFAILANVQHALRKGAVPKEEVDTFLKEAMSGDYNHLLRTCMNWVSVG